MTDGFEDPSAESQLTCADTDDAVWAAQIGPALTEPDVARLLRRRLQDVSADVRLLKLANRDGQIVYPVLQFRGGEQLPGIAEVLALLKDTLEPLTIAAWLTTPSGQLDQRRPIDILRHGEVGPVIQAARRLSVSAGGD